MNKKIPFALAAVFGLSAVLGGCNLFAIDQKAYYDQAVATVAYKNADSAHQNITLTKQDLMQGYSRYYQTLANNGMSGAALTDYLINLLLDQKIVINETTALIQSGKIKITNADKEQLWTDAYNGAIGLLTDYRKAVLEEYKITSQDIPADEETAKVVFNPYQRKAEIVFEDGKYVIKKLNFADPGDQTPVANPENLVQEMTQATIQTLATELAADPILQEAQRRYVFDIKKFYQSRGQNFATNSEAWEFDINRVCQEIMNNKYLSLYSEYLQKQSSGVDDISPVSVNDVFAYLEKKIRASYVKYAVNQNVKDDILDNRADVFYVPANNGEEFFSVSHILIKFPDNAFTELDKLLETKEIDEATYEFNRQQIINSLYVKEFGEVQSGFTAQDLYDQFSLAISDAKAPSIQEKMNVFNDFMYKYNEDEGNKNKEYDYVIGTTNSRMVDAFNEAGRALHQQGKIGAISGLVESNYGMHILIYLGAVENLFAVTNIDDFTLTNVAGAELQANIEKITSTKLSLLNNKTVFDLAYEKLTTNTVAMLETLNLNTLKSTDNMTITKYPKHYSDIK